MNLITTIKVKRIDESILVNEFIYNNNNPHDVSPRSIIQREKTRRKIDRKNV